MDYHLSYLVPKMLFLIPHSIENVDYPLKVVLRFHHLMVLREFFQFCNLFFLFLLIKLERDVFYQFRCLYKQALEINNLRNRLQLDFELNLRMHYLPIANHLRKLPAGVFHLRELL